MALLVKCLMFHMLCRPTDRTSIREEKGPKHLWPAQISKHPLDVCHAVAGLVSPHGPTWPPHSVQWPCTHKYTHPSTHLQTYCRHAVKLLQTHIHAHNFSLFIHHLHQPISLTTNNDLSGAVKPATKVQIRFMQLHSMSVFFVLTSLPSLKIVRFLFKKVVFSLAESHYAIIFKYKLNSWLIYFVQSRNEGCKCLINLSTIVAFLPVL